MSAQNNIKTVIPISQPDSPTALDSNGNEDEKTHVYVYEKGASWVTVALLQIGDIVGTGVLALGKTFSHVGYVPSALLMAFFLPFNVYVGYIMQETYLLCPEGKNTSKMAYATTNSKPFAIVTRILYYSFLLCVLAQYMELIAQNMGNLIPGIHGCHWEYSIISIICMLPFLQFKTLHESHTLQFINTISISLMVLFSVCYMLKNMHSTDIPSSYNYIEPEDRAVAIDDDIDVEGFIGTVLSLVFAFCGNIIYFDFLSEMPKPHKFYKSLFISTPYQLVVYSLAGFVQYSYLGKNTSGMIFEVIPKDNPLYGACAFLLIIHLFCAYMLKSTITCNSVLNSVNPELYKNEGMKGRLAYFGVTLAVALFSFIASSSIPNFFTLMDFVSAFQIAPLSFIIIPLCLVFARKKSGVQVSLSKNIIIFSVITIGVAICGMGIYTNSLELSDTFSGKIAGSKPWECNRT